MTTTLLKKEDVTRKWYIVDADGCNLGKLAVKVSNILRGKDKADYTPHVDCGDYVIIVNANKIAVTGNKMTDKIYYRHTGHPGGIKGESMKFLLSSKRSEDVLKKAISGMMSKGPLTYSILKKLKVYSSNVHNHEAQNPVVLDVAKLKLK
jgi:large subunit ribosomal protein L13